MDVASSQPVADNPAPSMSSQTQGQQASMPDIPADLPYQHRPMPESILENGAAHASSTTSHQASSAGDVQTPRRDRGIVPQLAFLNSASSVHVQAAANVAASGLSESEILFSPRRPQDIYLAYGQELSPYCHSHTNWQTYYLSYSSALSGRVPQMLSNPPLSPLYYVHAPPRPPAVMVQPVLIPNQPRSASGTANPSIHYEPYLDFIRAPGIQSPVWQLVPVLTLTPQTAPDSPVEAAAQASRSRRRRNRTRNATHGNHHESTERDAQASSGDMASGAGQDSSPSSAHISAEDHSDVSPPGNRRGARHSRGSADGSTHSSTVESLDGNPQHSGGGNPSVFHADNNQGSTPSPAPRSVSTATPRSALGSTPATSRGSRGHRTARPQTHGRTESVLESRPPVTAADITLPFYGLREDPLDLYAQIMADRRAARVRRSRATSSSDRYVRSMERENNTRTSARATTASVHVGHTTPVFANARHPGDGLDFLVRPGQARGLDDRSNGRPETLELDDMIVSMECQICYGQFVDTVLLPCAHAVLCRWCAEQHAPADPTNTFRLRRPLARCPICRKTITDKIRIYLPH